jgi:hypothetical protein
VPNDTAAKADQAQHQRDAHADFVKDRVEQEAAARGEEGNQHGAGDAMDEAEAGQADCHPVDRPFIDLACEHQPRLSFAALL